METVISMWTAWSLALKDMFEGWYLLVGFLGIFVLIGGLFEASRRWSQAKQQEERHREQEEWHRGQEQARREQEKKLEDRAQALAAIEMTSWLASDVHALQSKAFPAVKVGYERDPVLIEIFDRWSDVISGLDLAEILESRQLPASQLEQARTGVELLWKALGDRSNTDQVDGDDGYQLDGDGDAPDFYVSGVLNALELMAAKIERAPMDEDTAYIYCAPVYCGLVQFYAPLLAATREQDPLFFRDGWLVYSRWSKRMVEDGRSPSL